MLTLTGTPAEVKRRHLEQIGNSIEEVQRVERNAAASTRRMPAASDDNAAATTQRMPAATEPPGAPKTRGTPEAQLTDTGRTHPVPLTAAELAQTVAAQNARNKYLKSAREDATPPGLDPNSARLIGRSDAAIRDHLTPDDIAAQLKESRGVVIQGPNGRVYDHEDEVTNARTSVINNIEAIKAQMQTLAARGNQEHQIVALKAQFSKLSRLLDSMPRRP